MPDLQWMSTPHQASPHGIPANSSPQLVSPHQIVPRLCPSSNHEIGSIFHVVNLQTKTTERLHSISLAISARTFPFLVNWTAIVAGFGGERDHNKKKNLAPPHHHHKKKCRYVRMSLLGTWNSET